MGGRLGRSWFALASAVVLMVSSFSGGALASGACADAENGASAPPVGSPSVRVDFAWPERDDVIVDYWATSSTSADAYPAPPSWTGGCTDAAWGACSPLYPLVFSGTPIGGYNTESSAGTYTLMAMIHGACVYATKDGQPDNDRVAAVYDAVKEVKVDATIVDLLADGSARRTETLSAILTMPPDAGVSGEDYPLWWRVLGTFEWDPDNGVSGVQQAPLAASETAGVTESTHEQTPQDVDSASAPASEMLLSPEQRRYLGYLSILLALIFGPEAMMTFLFTGEWPVVEASGAPEVVQPALTKPTDPPSETPPKMSKKARAQQRQWVWLSAEAPVRKKGATHWLEPGVWYQTKEREDGSRAFYDKNGALIGRSPGGVELNAWGRESDHAQTFWPKTDEQAALGLLALVVDASAGLEIMKPATPPPASGEDLPGNQWVYVTMPTQAYNEISAFSQRTKSHVLMPGRWYRGSYRESKGNWQIYTADGVWLGEEPHTDFVHGVPDPPAAG